MCKRSQRSRIVIGAAATKEIRPCICCRKDFASYGRYNRLCSVCKTGEGDFRVLGLRPLR